MTIQANTAQPVPVSQVVAVLNGLFATREYDHALELIHTWWDAYRTEKEFLAIVNKIAGRSGQLSLAVKASHRSATLGAIRQAALLPLQGRLKELTENSTRIPGPVTPVQPVSDVRVLHLAKESRPYFSNGFAARSHYNFLAEKRAGLDPVVVTEPGFPSSALAERARPVTTFEGIAHHHLLMRDVGVQSLSHDRFLQLFADLALERVRALRPAVIHASSGRRGYETALVGLALKEKTGLPLIYEVRSFFEGAWTAEVVRETRGEIFERRYALETNLMERADAVLTICETMREEIIGRGIAPDKVDLVPNGVDLSTFFPGSRTTLATKLGVEGLPTFGYVSNMDHHRESQETLIRASASLSAMGVDHRCVLVGGGPRMRGLKELASELGVADQIIFTGSVPHDEVRDYYQLLDVFVVPRTRERAAHYVTPLKPFEAMAMKIPLVVSELPALMEVADPPHRGWGFPPDDHENLAGVLRSLFEDSTEAARRADAAYHWIVEERQWDSNGPRYRRVVERILSRGGDR